MPVSTWPGWLRQPRGVCVAVDVLINGAGVGVCCGVEAAGICVEGRVGCSSGEQAQIVARNMNRFIVHFVA